MDAQFYFIDLWHDSPRAPAGARIARLTGALALVAGLVIFVRVIEVTMSGAA